LTASETLKFLGRYVSFPPQLGREIGIEETIFLMNILYASQVDGEWVCRDSATLEEETSLSYKQQLRVRGRLKDLNLLAEKNERLEHVLYFHVQETVLDDLLSNLKWKFANLPKGSTPPSQREVGQLTKGKFVNNKEVELQEVREEEKDFGLGPKRDEVVELSTKEDVVEVFKSCKRSYRRKTGKSLGFPRGPKFEEFAHWVVKKTGDVILEAFNLWLEEQDRKFLRGVNWPFGMFMKNIADAVEAYEDKIGGEGEREAEEKEVELPKLGRRIGE